MNLSSASLVEMSAEVSQAVWCMRRCNVKHVKDPLLTLGTRMRSEGYSTWSVRLCVCLSVCFTLILELQATKRHVNGTLVFSATSARKIMWPIWLKQLRSRKRNRHRHGPRFVTQPTISAVRMRVYYTLGRAHALPAQPLEQLSLDSCVAVKCYFR